MTLKYLIQKEFLQIRRNAFLPKLIIMFPIVIMCVMPWVMQMEVKNIVVDVVDNDRSTRSQQIVHSIEASDYFISGGQKATYRDALAEIEHGKADVVLVIPQNYGKDLEMGKMPQVLIAANAIFTEELEELADWTILSDDITIPEMAEWIYQKYQETL